MEVTVSYVCIHELISAAFCELICMCSDVILKRGTVYCESSGIEYVQGTALDRFLDLSNLLCSTFCDRCV